MSKLVLALTTSAIDKLTSAAVILSGAAADDMEVSVFILVNAGHAFMKGNSGNLKGMSDTTQNAEDFQKALDKLSTPSWTEFFEMAKDMTEVKIYMCSLAGKIAGGEKKEDFIDMVDDIVGIGEYLDEASEADVNLCL
jgi:peroxiredoxin family protein